MTKKVIGFNSEDDFDRMSKSVRKSENTPQVGQRQRAKYPGGGGGLIVRRAVISQKGDYNTHKILFTSGTFTEDTSTDDVDATIGETVAYVGEEFDFRIEVGDPVRVAKFQARWWIIDAQQACRGYCIDDLDAGGYVYGWRLNAPPLTCCPEASGSHVLTTSDGGSTYESATFQCNGTGTTRKWVFNGSRLYISPMLDEGNVEFRTDRTVSFCSIELMQYESSVFPENSDCGKAQQSICLHPLCGVYTCSNASDGAPVEYAVSGYTSTPLIVEGGTSGSVCSWRNYTGDRELLLSVTASGATTTITITEGASTITYNLGASIDFDTWGENIFYIDSGDAVTFPSKPATITIYPNTNQTIESNCNPNFYRLLRTQGASGDILCTSRPFRYYIEPSGVTDGTCSGCNAFNTQTVLFYEEDFTKGNNFNSAYISLDCGGAGNKFWRLVNYRSIGAGTAGTRLTLESLSGSDIVTYETDNGADYIAQDCWHGPITLDYVSDNGNCATWPATITVSPAT